MKLEVSPGLYNIILTKTQHGGKLTWIGKLQSLIYSQR